MPDGTAPVAQLPVNDWRPTLRPSFKQRTRPMRTRIGKIIDWWCTGIAVVVTIFILAAATIGTGDHGTIEMVCILFGIPAAAIFLVGKSARFILSDR